jgi:hypothetical protein
LEYHVDVNIGCVLTSDARLCARGGSSALRVLGCVLGIGRGHLAVSLCLQSHWSDVVSMGAAEVRTTVPAASAEVRDRAAVA